MPYSVDPSNPFSPLDTDQALVSDELRALKGYIQNTVLPDITALQAALAAATTNLIGQVIAFSSSTPPTNYLACPNMPTDVSRATYAALFAVIGTTWGAGDGTTTFGLPYFPQGYVPVAASVLFPVSTVTLGEVNSHTHTFSTLQSYTSGGFLRCVSTQDNEHGTIIQVQRPWTLFCPDENPSTLAKWICPPPPVFFLGAPPVPSRPIFPRC